MVFKMVFWHGMRLRLFSPANKRLHYSRGVILFEGEFFHGSEERPEAVYLRIGDRIVCLRRVEQTCRRTHFKGRFVMGTGFKFLELFVRSANCERRLWCGLWFNLKKFDPVSLQNPRFQIPAPPLARSLPPRGGQARIAVVLHLYYTDLWPEFEAYVSQIPETFDLYVTSTPENIAEIGRLARGKFPFAKIIPVENRGRDVLPFLHVLQNTSLGRYEFICKIHSKKTINNKLADGDFWRRALLCDILGAPDIVGGILKRFENDPRLGLVTAWNYLRKGPLELNNPNYEKVRQIAVCMGLENIPPYVFPAGTMFWARAKALVPLLDAGITREEFPDEQGQRDGTAAHAVERAIGLSVQEAGFYCGQTPEILRERQNG
jgi:hypothetical protein